MSEEDCFHKLEEARSLLLELPDIHARVNGAQWLRRLSGPEAGAGDLALRPRYLQLLLASLRKGRLLGPFAKAPPCGPLDPLPAEENVERLTGHWEKKKSGSRGPPPVASESSAGGREYAAAQMVPGFGVQCYLAVAPPTPPPSPPPTPPSPPSPSPCTAPTPATATVAAVPSMCSRGCLSGPCGAGGGVASASGATVTYNNFLSDNNNNNNNNTMAGASSSAATFASVVGAVGGVGGTSVGGVGGGIASNCSTPDKGTLAALRRLSGAVMEGCPRPVVAAMAGVEAAAAAASPSVPINTHQPGSSVMKGDDKQDSILNIVKQMRQREAERRARAEAASWGTYAHSCATTSAATGHSSNMAASVSGFGDGATHFPAFDRWGRPERDL